MFAILAASAVLVLVLILGRDTSPQPQPDGTENGEEEQTDYTPFQGNLFFNGEELELSNTPLIAKGILHLPLLELAEELNVDIDVNQDENTIFIGETGQTDEDGSNGVKIYRGSTEITPANIIRAGDEYYIEAKEYGPLLGLSFYENIFANSAYLFDDSISLRDGSYVVTGRRDGRGWAPELRLEVSGGRIASVDYVELNEEGSNKFEDQEYLNNWSNAGNVDPLDLIEEFQDQLIETQSVAAVDITSGATGSWKNFLRLSANVLGKAKADVLTGQYPDSNYIAVGNPSDQGWTPVVEFSTAGGRITEFRYDDIDEEGNSKRGDDQYLENWRNVYPEVDPVGIVSEREENILRTQDPNLIDATTGATQWGVNIKQYTTGALEQASLAQLPGGYDTIYVFFGPQTERGDRPQLLVAAAGETILSVDFSDYRDGIPKKHDEPYLASWREQYPDVDPLAVLQEMENTFLETENPDDLDAISGATSWRNSFQELAARALEFIRD